MRFADNCEHNVEIILGYVRCNCYNSWTKNKNRHPLNNRFVELEEIFVVNFFLEPTVMKKFWEQKFCINIGIWTVLRYNVRYKEFFS